MSANPRLSPTFRAYARTVAFTPPRPVVVITATGAEVTLGFLCATVIVGALLALASALGG